jgi:cytochrome P450
MIAAIGRPAPARALQCVVAPMATLFTARSARPPVVPRSSLLGGNLDELTRDALGLYGRVERDHFGVAQIRVYNRFLYIVTDPALIEAALVDQHRSFIKGPGLADLQILFGEGLLTADGATWRAHRKALGPHFQTSRMPAYAALIADATRARLAAWPDDGVVDVYREAAALALTIVMRSLFGRELPGAAEHAAAIIAALQRCQKELAHFSEGGRAAFAAAIATLDRWVLDVIDELGAAAGDDVVNTLLATHRADPVGMTREHVRDEIVTLLLSGYETTATALSWTLHLLSRHPAVAAALRAELAAAPADTFDPARTPVLMQVLCEGLRLYPPAHRVSRRAVAPVELGGHRFAAGTDFVIPQWAVQRSARWFDQPDAFRPDRWTPALRAALPRFAYFPFGGGPRKCVGEQLALRELVLVIAAVAREFDLAPTLAEVVPYDGITLVPNEGTLPLEIRRRAPSPGVTQSARCAVSRHRLGDTRWVAA